MVNHNKRKKEMASTDALAMVLGAIQALYGMVREAQYPISRACILAVDQQLTALPCMCVYLRYYTGRR